MPESFLNGHLEDKKTKFWHTPICTFVCLEGSTPIVLMNLRLTQNLTVYVILNHAHNLQKFSWLTSKKREQDKTYIYLKLVIELKKLCQNWTIMPSWCIILQLEHICFYPKSVKTSPHCLGITLTAKYSVVQYSVVQCSKFNYSTLQYSTVHYIAVQQRAAQYIRVRYCTVLAGYYSPAGRGRAGRHG